MAKKPTSTVGRAFDVLRVLRSSTVPMQLTAVANEAGIAASSAHSVLTQLLEQQVVVLDEDKRYTLGPTIFYVGTAYARTSSLYRAIWVELVNVANEFAISCALAVPWEGHHLIIASHRGGDSDVAVPLGGRVPLDGSSWGKVYFEWSDQELPEQLTAYGPNSITDRTAYQAELAVARRTGYTVDNGEFAEGIGGVCAPITSNKGYEGLASCLGPLELIESIGITQLGRRLAGLASRASLALGDTERIQFFGSE